MKNLDLAAETKRIHETVIELEMTVAKIKIQHLAANFDNLTPKEVAKFLRELADNGKNIAKHERYTRIRIQ